MFHIKVAEKLEHNFMLSNFFAENRDVYEMWKIVVQRGMPKMTIRRSRSACWIPKATHTHTHTHTGCVLLIAFPLQQWFHERVSISYVHCPSCTFTYIKCLNVLRRKL
jgi:hypothetical protein